MVNRMKNDRMHLLQQCLAAAGVDTVRQMRDTLEIASRCTPEDFAAMMRVLDDVLLDLERNNQPTPGA